MGSQKYAGNLRAHDPCFAGDCSGGGRKSDDLTTVNFMNQTKESYAIALFCYKQYR